TRCSFCGESLIERPSGAHTQIEAGDVLSRTWEIFQKKLGLLIGAMLIQFGIWIAMVVVMYVAQLALMFSMIRPGAARPGAAPNLTVLIAAFYGPVFIFMLLFFVVSSFLEGGCHLLLLRLVRGERAEIGDLFAGSRYFWRMFLSNLAFMTA